MSDAANPAVGTDNPATVEAEFIRTQQHNRMLSRSAPIRTVEDTDDDGGGIVLGAAILWDGKNRRKHEGRGGVVRYHRSFGPNSTPAVASDNLLYIPLGTCSLDKTWELRSVLILYQDPWTAGATGSQAAVFAGSSDSVGVRIQDVILMGIAIPANVTWSHDQAVIYGGQSLYVVIDTPGASPGLYMVGGSVLEFDAMDYRTRHV